MNINVRKWKSIIFKILTYNYAIYLILAIFIGIPLMLLVYGVHGVWVSIVKNNDLSYKRFKKGRRKSK